MPLKDLSSLIGQNPAQSNDPVNPDRYYQSNHDPGRRAYYKTILKVAINNYPDIRQGLHHVDIDIYERDNRYYLINHKDRAFIPLDQLLEKAEYHRALEAFNASGELQSEIASDHLFIPPPIIAESIDDEAINGRNRRRKKTPAHQQQVGHKNPIYIMIIIIGNQKGGAGKSTLTLLLANYLTMVKKRKVTVIDMDYQQSIAQKYEKAKVLENEEPYEVVAASLEDYPDLLELLKTDAETLVLIDLPGKLDDDGLLPVFKSADLVICPFAYDEFSFESTILFSVVLKKLRPDCEMIFVPNRIKANVKYDTQADVDEQLNKFGMVTSGIPDRIDFQRTSTFQTPISVFPSVRPVFDELYKQHLKLKPNE